MRSLAQSSILCPSPSSFSSAPGLTKGEVTKAAKSWGAQKDLPMVPG